MSVGRWLLAGLYVLLAAKNTWWPAVLSPWADGQVGWLSMWFCAGALFFVFARHVPLWRGLFIAAALTTLVCVFKPTLLLYRCVAPLSMGYSLFWLALKLPLTWWDKRGDFSYGLYIYAFPFQQLLASLGLQQHGVAVFMVTSLLGATLLAVFSYRYVEKPALRWKHWLATARTVAAPS